MNPTSDEALIIKVQQGHISAYEELVKRYQQRLFRFILRFVFNDGDAEELVQDVLVTVYTHIDRIDPKQQFYSYVFTVAKNAAISFLRAKKKTVPLHEIEIAVEDESLYEQVMHHGQQEEIAKVMQSLDKKYRSILALYYFQDLSYEEISVKTQLPINTVRTRLRRAKDELRKQLTL